MSRPPHKPELPSDKEDFQIIFEQGTPLETLPETTEGVAADHPGPPPVDDTTASKPGGYGNPPVETRFQRNAPSPNPRGRPPGIPQPGAFTRRMNEPYTTRNGIGEEITMPTIEALRRIVAEGTARNNPRLRKIRDEQLAREARLSAEEEATEAARPPFNKTRMELDVLRNIDEITWPRIEPALRLIGELTRLGVIHFPEKSNVFKIADWVKARLPKAGSDK